MNTIKTWLKKSIAALFRVKEALFPINWYANPTKRANPTLVIKRTLVNICLVSKKLVKMWSQTEIVLYINICEIRHTFSLKILRQVRSTRTDT